MLYYLILLIKQFSSLLNRVFQIYRLIKNPKIVHFENVKALLAQNGHLAPFFKTIWKSVEELETDVENFIKSDGKPNDLTAFPVCLNSSLIIYRNYKNDLKKNNFSGKDMKMSQLLLLECLAKCRNPIMWKNFGICLLKGNAP
jgi:hypothetical protein